MENSEVSLPPLGPPAPMPPAPAHTPAEPSSAGDAFGSRGEGAFTRARKRFGGILAAIGALIAKFWVAVKGVLILLPKIKFLGTAGTALVSVVAYSLFFGWWFAVGFVVLIFVHEMGHVIQLRREGVPATAPMFIPLFGAVVGMKAMPENALAEARVGLAGPVLGTVGSGVCLLIAEAANSDFFRALAYIGFFLNLFNLLPVVPLDGGRAMAAMAPWMWFVGFGTMVFLELLFPTPILFLIIIFSGFQLYHRWSARKTGSVEQAAYYRVSPRNRLLVGAVYVGLLVALVVGLDATHILHSSGHSFGHL